ncbi:MAG TPA: molybdopterin-dependent oxidoreductase [Candidatus Sulfotelmatobacter sp.]|nr:molybdopterin-dependent oxidoreductase [Candidatus Sulfotelmatobacter sp.]
MPGLGTSFGRGGATTAQQDLSNADAILIMGSSMAENHPVGFQWVMEARERGAKVIHVDPRFTRTSAMADIWVPLRAGSDIAFLGGLINYVLQNNKEFRDYVVAYTNAPTILREDFQDTEALDGFFSGWNEEKKAYDPHSWLYEHATEGEKQAGGGGAGHQQTGGGQGKDRGGEIGDPARGENDLTLQNPRCVYQVLKRHFSRYTPEMVERCCGVSRDVFLRAAEAFSNASGPDKTAAICYAVGWTQHSKGVQIIRSAAILQLLLGNIGRPGGGILALRGHASIQGSTDIPTLYDILPGYLPMPFFEQDSHTLDGHIRKHRTRTGIWSGFDSYLISLLKAYYGDSATRENSFGFDWIPRVTGDHSHLGYWLDMQDGKMEGLFIMGQNPAVGAPNAKLQRTALSKLKWLVVRDMVEIESASFWYDSPEARSGELRPENIATEVFLFPAAGTAEKAGTFTNTQRLLQFRQKAIDPPGDARSESWFIYHLGRRVREKASRNRSPRDAGLLALTWDYPLEEPHGEPQVEAVLKEINGYTVANRKQLKHIQSLKNDGSTACGAWIYCGVFPDENRNRANERKPKDLLGHGWGFSWPNDCRIIYNRASARPDGRPWSERKKLIWWDAAQKKWTGTDQPDFTEDMDPATPSNLHKGHGVQALGGARPFTLHQDGVGWLFVPSGLKDGPLPTHYEPLESFIDNPLYGQQTNPVAKKKERPDNPYAAEPHNSNYPYVLMTYRLTEHHTAGGMSRTLSHLAELQPELFTEVSPELAAERGLVHGDHAIITTPRASIHARVLVTRRMKPLIIEGRTVHQVGVPYHWGYSGTSKGDIVNNLLAISEEPNVRIMETKALVCDITPASTHKPTAVGRRQPTGVL